MQMTETKTAAVTAATQCADGACSLPKPTPEEELRHSREAAYMDQAQHLTPLTVAELDKQRAAGHRVTVMFSRKTCPWCQVMMPNLVLAQAAAGQSVAYVDTLATPTDAALKAFRDQWGIKYVPTLLVFQDGQVAARYDGDRSIADITAFLKQQ